MTSLAEIKERAFGPRVPREEIFRDPLRFLLPTIFIGVAGILLIISTFFPYWTLEMQAPQFPKGLEIQVYVDEMVGDVHEIDGLNHYIGMRPLSEAGQLERSLSIIMVGVVIGLLVGAVYVHNPCALILTWPAVLWPAIFLGDLFFWMWNFGTHLDEGAAFSNIIDPFTPPIIGQGTVAQFHTNAVWDTGLLIAFGASGLVIVGLILHRRAYKPLLDRVKAERAAEAIPVAEA
ncbi:MAG: cytochrome C [Chloroflexi bacterium]|nr:cytochrome C [Chloroflexota bacterium]